MSRDHVPLTPLGWARRILSAVVCLTALALVMAKTGASAPSDERVGLISAFCFVVSLIALVEVARREHAESERASTERERQQLALLQMQVELAKKARAAEAQRLGDQS
ncbi:MAG: hypothetical protein RL685_658 [Pseudomonadota bacterium]